MADEQEKTINEEAGLPANWQPIDSAPVVPGSVNVDPLTTKGPFYQTNIAPSLQLDINFSKTSSGGPASPATSLMPLSSAGNPITNASIQSTASTTPAPTPVSDVVTSLNTLYGALELLAGTGIGISTSGLDEIIITNDGVVSLNGLSGALSILAGAGIAVSTSGNDIYITNDGVVSLNSLTGAVSVDAGTGIGISESGNAIYVTNDGVVSLNSLTGALSLVAGSGISISESGSDIYITNTGGGGSAGGVNEQTSSYNVSSGDLSKIVVMNSSSNTTITLPSPPPSSTFYIFVQNISTGTVTLSPNGLDLDGDAASLSIEQNQGVYVSTDGTNYFTERGMGSGGGGGVTSLNSLTGALAIEAGTGIGVSASGSGIYITNDGVVSLNSLTGALSILAGTGIGVSVSGNDVYITNDGVTSLNGLTGAVAVEAGTGIGVSTSGNDVYVTNDGVTSLNGLTGAVAIEAGSGISISTSGNDVYISATGGGGGSFFPLNLWKRYGYIILGGTAVTSLGEASNAVNAYNTYQAPVSNQYGPGWSASGNTAVWNGMTTTDVNWQFGKNLAFQMVGCMLRNTNVRWWACMGSAVGGSWLLTDTPGDVSFGFRFSTNASDTDFMCFTYDGATLNITSSGVTADTNSHLFSAIYSSTGSTITYYIDNVQVAQLSSNFPSSTQHLAPSMGGNMISTSLNPGFVVEQIVLQQDF